VEQPAPVLRRSRRVRPAHPGTLLGLETEGFPLVYLEAASAGLPVIAGAAAGGRGGGGRGDGDHRRRPQRDETAFAIIRLLDDPALARTMGTLGRQRVLSGFTWDEAVDQFRTALRKHAG